MRKDKQRRLDTPDTLYPVYDIAGHHAVKEMPILRPARGLTARSEHSPRKTTLDDSDVVHLKPSQLDVWPQSIAMPMRSAPISRAISSIGGGKKTQDLDPKRQKDLGNMA